MHSGDNPVDGPLQYVPTTVNNAMNDFEEMIIHVDPDSIDNMISNLNHGQLKVFQKVKDAIEAQWNTVHTEHVEILWLFVSGCG